MCRPKTWLVIIWRDIRDFCLPPDSQEQRFWFFHYRTFFRLLPQWPRLPPDWPRSHLASGQRSGIFRMRGVRTPYLEHQKSMLYHSANHIWNGFCLWFCMFFSSLRWRNLILLAFSISIRITQLKKHGTWLCDKVSRWLKSEVVWRVELRSSWIENILRPIDSMTRKGYCWELDKK